MDDKNQGCYLPEESLFFSSGLLPEEITHGLYILEHRIHCLDTTIKYLKERSCCLYDGMTARMIDNIGREYGILPGAENDYRIQVLNYTCSVLGPEVDEEGRQLEVRERTVDLQDFLERQHPKVTDRSDDHQLAQALNGILAEYRRLCRVRLAALLMLRDISQTEDSQIGHSYQVDQATGVFWEILKVPNTKYGYNYKLPSTKKHMKNVLSDPENYRISIDKRTPEPKEPLFCRGTFFNKNDAATAAALISEVFNLSIFLFSTKRYPSDQQWKEICRRSPILKEFIETIEENSAKRV